MNFKNIGLSRIFLLLILFYVLGFTHFLGGPFGLARFLFYCILIGFIILILFIWKILKFANKISKASKEQEIEKETIKVDATIIE